MDAPPLTCHTAKLTPDQGARLHTLLRERGYEFREVPHARFAAARDKLTIVFYESGKLVVQGKGTRELVEFVLEPEILQRAELGYEAVLDPSLLDPRLGVDESGKGDFFGPLCIAGVYVNRAVLEGWKGSGLRDSKSIQSERKIEELARMIRSSRGCVSEVVAIGNPAYNRMHTKLGSVNRILAWGHARVIENLMGRVSEMDPPPVRAISDQFALSKGVLQKALMPLGREIELVQRHRAEEDAAVAAASVLARWEYVSGLAALGRKYGFELPKGASAAVEARAREFVERHGAGELANVVKTHFRTLQKVLG